MKKLLKKVLTNANVGGIICKLSARDALSRTNSTAKDLEN